MGTEEGYEAKELSDYDDMIAAFDCSLKELVEQQRKDNLKNDPAKIKALKKRRKARAVAKKSKKNNRKKK